MTTVEEYPEMDEFFNFDDASRPLDHNDIDFSGMGTGPYDINLAFAEPELDEDACNCLQHFSDPDAPLVQSTNTAMMGPDDFTDFPRWIDGMTVPSQSCAYCRRMRIHCKIIREGVRMGSCTSCVALARSCDLSHPNPIPRKDDAHRCASAPGFFFNGKTPEDNIECDGTEWCAAIVPEPCESCQRQSLRCDPVTRGNRTYTCSNCVSFACPCSLSNEGMLDIMEGVDAGSRTPDVVEKLPGLNRITSNLVSFMSSDENLNTGMSEKDAKVGARFSREALRILRGWLSTHASHPYPTDEEKESLRRQTGLNKTQITNWLANARRRGKVRQPRSTSPSVRSRYAEAMDIPRRSTPALETMNPLERWKNSPPEHEAASVTAIAKAVSTYSSGMESPSTNYVLTDDGSNRSLCNVSSASSLGTSNSSGVSFASAFSHKSRNSFGSFGSFGDRGRRRRRRPAAKPVKVTPMAGPPRTFQCTFCTETFKTKHDWQRHEKSLHLSLERWVCSPDGPSQFCADYGHNRCVFCGLPNPTAEHAEEHNYSNCADRTLEERTFYRKDHLRQHLNLVHDVKFQNFSMETWKVATPEIRSRCGFCGIIMDSWSIRVDHLAEHFKGGKSMADWKGDWGFERQVLDIVENGMPPYLIHDERNSMNPYEASKVPGDQRTLEDLVKIGLVEYLQEKIPKGLVPTDDELLQEARKVVRKADDIIAVVGDHATWFRDLIMLSGTTDDEVPEHATDTYSKPLEIISARVKDSRDLNQIICSKQRALISFVDAKQALGLTPTDRELQVECCKILDDVEVTSNYKCKGAVGWFKYLVTNSDCWLRAFRRRCGLPRSSEMASELIRSTDETSIDYSIHNEQRLERELQEWVKFQLALGKTPSDADIQTQARMIVYKNDDPWNQTALDNPPLLHLFKRQNGLAPKDEYGLDTPNLPVLNEVAEHGISSHSSPQILHWDFEETEITRPSPVSSNSNSGPITPVFDRPLHTLVSNQPSCNTNPVQPLKYFLNDANCYGRLVRELSRFVTTCMSPNNPNQHVPSDAEIQNQARWTIYDDDDPWNQTAADNAEWLIRFKRDVGLAPREDGPGLPDPNLDVQTWRIDSEGSGFSPPYICPKDPKTVREFTEDVPVTVKDKVYTIKAKTAGKFLQSMQQRWQKPATVFCSRELEHGLNDLVFSEVAQGRFPSDDDLRAKAREILRVQETSADNQELLNKFKAMHGVQLSLADIEESMPRPLSTDEQFLAEFDQELKNMDFSSVSSSLEMMGNGSAHGPMSNSSTLPPRLSLLSQALASNSSPGSPSTSPLASFSLAGQQNGAAFGFGSGSPSTGMSKSPIFTSSSGSARHSTSKGPGMAPDYAEMARVHAATASPLRRRASAKSTARAGIQMPATLVEMLHGSEAIE